MLLQFEIFRLNVINVLKIRFLLIFKHFNFLSQLHDFRVDVKSRNTGSQADSPTGIKLAVCVRLVDESELNDLGEILLLASFQIVNLLNC